MGVQTQEPFDTNLLLMLKYKTPYVALELVVKDFLQHLDMPRAIRRANRQQLPFPTFKPDGEKSTWMVSLNDLASYLDKAREQASKDWNMMHKDYN